MNNRWKMNKFGLVNFWYYDVEEFDLEDGKLLLRGSNGSGKSVTMQSFIPLLLDGNKSPERLDPFGTKARTITNYLLDENTDEKTAYLYIEFKREDVESYLSIGMGIKALKGKSPQSWYFILKDGRRLNKDLYLYKDTGEKIPLTKKELQNRLGEGNFYTESQKSYMEKVNEVLFGFDEIEYYEELLNLLISVRSPKLSKDFKPTEIYKILTNSLKVLSEDDLRPMSESMENMDNYKNTLEDSERALNACENIKRYYDRYNRFILLEKSKKLIDAHKDLCKVEDLIKRREEDKKIGIIEEGKKEEEIKFYEEELKVKEENLDKLRNREEFKLSSELTSLKNALEESTEEKFNKEKVLEDKKKKERYVELEIKDEYKDIDLKVLRLKDILNELEALCEEGFFIEGKGLEKEILNTLSEECIDLVEPALRAYIKNLKSSKVSLEEYDKVNTKRNELVEIQDLNSERLYKVKKELRDGQELYVNEVEDIKVRILEHSKESKEFNLIEEENKSIFKLLDSIRESREVSTLSEATLRIKGNKENSMKGEIVVLNNRINDKNAIIDRINNEIKELKEKKDIAPITSEGAVRNRERLIKEGIPFVPLYKAIDFKKNVSEELRNKIEASLSEMGLLNALCIEETYRGRALNFNNEDNDKYIFSEPNFMRHNLTNYLEVDKDGLNGVPYEVVDNVIQGIFLEDNTITYLDEYGSFGIGVLQGKSGNEYISKYIGEASRKRAREEKILNFKEEIKSLQFEINQLNGEINILNERIKILEFEYNNFPSFTGLFEGLTLIKSKENEVAELDEKGIKISNDLFKITDELNVSKAKVYEELSKVPVKNLKDVCSSIELMDEYYKILNNCKLTLSEVKHKKEIINHKEDLLEDIIQDIDRIYYEINKVNVLISKNEIRIKSIQETLRLSSIEEIQREIENCLKVREKHPIKIKSLNEELKEIQFRIRELSKDIVTNGEKAVELNKKLEVLKEVYLEEEALEMISLKVEGDPVLKAKKNFKELDSGEKKTREDYVKSLMESINKYGGELRDYNLKTTDIFNMVEDEYTTLRRRYEIKCRVQGKEVGFLKLMNEIEKSIEEQRLLISEEERKVFEDVLVNTISQKINGKIKQSRAWVKKVNDLMESMDTSSSLKLSLSWVPNKAEGEGELDISNIIDIFDRKSLCTDKEFKALGDHFTQKVQEALRKYEGSGEVRNYHTIIKEVLDYRQWYEFKLNFSKKGERKRELTNNAFFQFSGGEKAMSMYIPLFSAVYARYEKGNASCPRIIAMDEAFAGVDENNIRDMFRLLNNLDLDYILNSQVLWGDYDTVKSLAIAELLREDNDDVVTVLRYIWNGKERKLQA